MATPDRTLLTEASLSTPGPLSAALNGIRSRLTANEGSIASLIESGGGGSDTLVPVAAGANITLPAAEVGDLFGYSLAGSAFVNDAPLTAGDYVFRKTATGWDYRKLADSTVLTVVPDTTAPTAGTLKPSAITDAGFTLTVSGSSDNRALHSSPYAFSLDGGANWSVWQSSAVYAVTGRTASTLHSCRHRVRDTAGNVSMGTAITVTTAAVALGLPITDTFSGTGRDLTGHGTTTGGGVWLAPNGNLDMWNTFKNVSAKIAGGEVVGTDREAGGYNRLDVGQADFTVSVDYALSSTRMYQQIVLGVRQAPSGGSTGIMFRPKYSGSAPSLLVVVDGIEQIEFSGLVPESGTLALVVSGSQVAASIGAQSKTFTYTANPTQTQIVLGTYGNLAGFGASNLSVTA